MNNDELKAIFDRQASFYDQKLVRMAPMNNGLYFLLESVFAGLPSDARVLCVGVGTGNELLHLARKYPQWHFTGVDPSGPMLDVCRQRVEEEGFTSRCSFHEGYLDSLSVEKVYDAATCFLVSQFIVDKEARSAFFREIGDRLKPDGILANADLSSASDSDNFEALLRVWQNVMSPTDSSPEGRDRLRGAYTKDVAVLPPAEVASIIRAGGFGAPVQFFQAGFIHAWFARCTLSSAASR